MDTQGNSIASIGTVQVGPSSPPVNVRHIINVCAACAYKDYCMNYIWDVIMKERRILVDQYCDEAKTVRDIVLPYMDNSYLCLCYNLYDNQCDSATPEIEYIRLMASIIAYAVRRKYYPAIIQQLVSITKDNLKCIKTKI